MTPRTLLAYVPWLARDLSTKAIVPLVFCLTLGGIPTLAWSSTQDVLDIRGNPVQAAFLQDVYLNLAPLCFTLGAFLFMTQSVALDRERQHVRFLFAQPVPPAGFYLTRFVVGLGLYLLCFLPLPLALRAVGVDIPVVGSLVALFATLVLIGGLSTLCGALVQREGLLLIVTYVGVQVMQQVARQDLLPDWGAAVARGLPPILSLGDVMRALLRGLDWPTTDLVHILGYGLGMFAAGLLVLRRAPLVR